MLQSILKYLSDYLQKHTTRKHESEIIKRFLLDPQYVHALIAHFKARDDIKFHRSAVSARVYYSLSGKVRVEDDIYGYEVTIGDRGLLDCNYMSYGITLEKAQELFSSILSNVPGTVMFEEKYPLVG